MDLKISMMENEFTSLNNEMALLVQRAKDSQTGINTFRHLLVHMICTLIAYIEYNITQIRPEVIKLFTCSTQLSTKFQPLIKAKVLTNKEVSCFKSLRCCIYHANKC